MGKRLENIRLELAQYGHAFCDRKGGMVYTEGTAAVLRAKECVMKTVTKIQENAEYEKSVG